MRQEFRITATRPSVIIDNANVKFRTVHVTNPTSSPIAIRYGGSDFANNENANLLVPANSDGSYALPNVNLLTAIFTGTVPTVLSVGTFGVTATIIVSDETALGSFGAMSASNLASSSIFAGPQAVTNGGVYGPIDLRIWGGLLVSYVGGTTPPPAQGVIRIAFSNTIGGTETDFGVLPIWPGQGFTVQIPRIDNFCKIYTNKAQFETVGTILSGTINVRATISEILELSPIGQSIPYVQTIGFNGTVPQTIRVDLYTGGLRALEISALQLTAGTPIVFESLTGNFSSDLVNDTLDSVRWTPGMVITMDVGAFTSLYFTNNQAALLFVQLSIKPIFDKSTRTNREIVRAINHVSAAALQSAGAGVFGAAGYLFAVTLDKQSSLVGWNLGDFVASGGVGFGLSTSNVVAPVGLTWFQTVTTTGLNTMLPGNIGLDLSLKPHLWLFGNAAGAIPFMYPITRKTYE